MPRQSLPGGTRCDWSGEKPLCVAPSADGEPCVSAEECRSNGCSAPVFGSGVCGEPRVCDGDSEDDEDVIAACAQDRGERRVQCKLASEGPWSCDCLKKDTVETHCSPGLTDPNADVCNRLNCCP
ncbi:hypothetical protein OV079_26605 [Nannocystis pusilla]|uniref:Uncharacterized protein n=1 Tax=Nannocystis pusilla TaxID=889268 RepID=A0A9X3ERV6_9BACT|nr:hypothetical protein [Nannocystis pusilla]MCY1009068.1 hypothetical protein [Nannocystis pusilla]